MHRGLRESAFLALGVIAIVLFVALASYSPEDRGFSFTGDSAVVHNRVGPIGAWLADVLFFLFGWPAYLFPFMFALSCWALLRHRGKSEGGGSRANTAVRVGGFMLVLAASCGLATLHWDAGELHLAGGVVGELIGSGLKGGL